MHSASARAPASVVGGGAVGLCSSALAGCVDESRLPSIPFLAKLRGAARARASRRKGCGTLDQHKRWFNFDPCGLVCASLVYYIVLFSTYTVLTKIIWPWFGGPFDYLASFLHSALFTTFATLALVSHMRTMLSNPGAVPFNARPTSPEGWAHECRKCRNFKPERAHHCSICGRCVVKMDHHCPWVNNCVGLANHKFFLLFLLYICTMCIYALVLIAGRFWYCMRPSTGAQSCDVGGLGGGFSVLLTTVFAVLFMLFTCCLGLDQSSVITTNQTQIDRMKNHAGSGRGSGGGGAQYVDERRRVLDNLSEVVGGDAYKEGFRIQWLLPTPIVYTNPEALTGYCFRDTPRPKSLIEEEQV